jgi:nitrite reductase/ring-hydroxylating ferredoxin subunit
MSGDALLRLCAATEVAEDAPLRAERDGFAYAVFLWNGRFFVAADACTHGPGSLSEGYVEGGEVECPFHQGRFDLATGRPTAPPCTAPVRTWTVHVVEGQVCIDPAERGRPA